MLFSVFLSPFAPILLRLVFFKLSLQGVLPFRCVAFRAYADLVFCACVNLRMSVSDISVWVANALPRANYPSVIPASIC